jgi:DNA-binding winged helix-turn-helix (wHTH) protein
MSASLQVRPKSALPRNDAMGQQRRRQRLIGRKSPEFWPNITASGIANWLSSNVALCAIWEIPYESPTQCFPPRIAAGKASIPRRPRRPADMIRQSGGWRTKPTGPTNHIAQLCAIPMLSVEAMSGPAAYGTLKFGPFELSIGERLLRREGVVLPLGSRALDILIYLVDHRGEVIAKQELIDHVWSDVTVEEGSLRVHVAAIRKALGDGQFDNRYIANIKGRGYSFVGTVVPLAGSTESRNYYVALSTLGYQTALFSGDFDTAREMVDRAVAVNPNSLRAWEQRGWTYVIAGQPEEAIRSFARTIWLSLFDPSPFSAFTGMGAAFIGLGRFDEAVAATKMATHQNPLYPVTYRFLAIALAHLRREAEAREAAAGLLKLEPGFRISEWPAGRRLPQIYIDGLRKAGLPE